MRSGQNWGEFSPSRIEWNRTKRRVQMVNRLSKNGASMCTYDYRQPGPESEHDYWPVERSLLQGTTSDNEANAS